MRSEKLIHFTSTDPIPSRIPEGKLRQSAEISDQVADFKAKGGVIQVVGSEANCNPEFILGNTIRPKK
jgi:hypothetical protein